MYQTMHQGEEVLESSRCQTHEQLPSLSFKVTRERAPKKSTVPKLYCGKCDKTFTYSESEQADEFGYWRLCPHCKKRIFAGYY
jgi:uncharacterized CHY-type Zn-finger protein